MDWLLAEIAQHDSPGVFAFASQESKLFVSIDKERWVPVADVPEGTVGRVIDWPLVEVDGQLKSAPNPGDIDNLAFCHGEVFAYGEAELVESDDDLKTYRLGELVRGLRGSMKLSHAPGELVGFLDLQAVFVALGRDFLSRAALWWKCVPYGEPIARHRAFEFPVEGIRAPAIDGTGPSVSGSAGREPMHPSWGERWIVGDPGANGEVSGSPGASGWGRPPPGAVVTWLDRWIREPVALGRTVWSVQAGSRLMWTGSSWVPM